MMPSASLEHLCALKIKADLIRSTFEPGSASPSFGKAFSHSAHTLAAGHVMCTHFLCKCMYWYR